MKEERVPLELTSDEVVVIDALVRQYRETDDELTHLQELLQSVRVRIEELQRTLEEIHAEELHFIRNISESRGVEISETDLLKSYLDKI